MGMPTAEQSMKPQVASIPAKNYKEVIEIRVPVRFYWAEDSFDGMEFGEFAKELLPWEEFMVHKCLDEIQSLMRQRRE